MAAPTVTSVTPNTGTYTGGTTVLIVGTGLTAAIAVKIGGQSCDFEISSATLLAATTPAADAGAARVAVTNADGTSDDVVNFTYTGGPGMFSVAEARAYDKAQLTSATTYPSAAIIAKEIAIRAKFERIIGVSLLPVASTEYYDGDGTSELYLAHHMPWSAPTPSPVTLTSVTVIAADGTETAFTVAELADVVKYPHKLVRRAGTFPRGHRNIKVVYSHGFVTCPEDIKQAALQVATLAPPDGLIPSPVTSYATGGTDENGAINWARVKDPARGRWYGHESIDGVLRDYRSIEMLPGIA